MKILLTLTLVSLTTFMATGCKKSKKSSKKSENTESKTYFFNSDSNDGFCLEMDESARDKSDSLKTVTVEGTCPATETVADEPVSIHARCPTSMELDDEKIDVMMVIYSKIFDEDDGTVQDLSNIPEDQLCNVMNSSAKPFNIKL